MKKILKIIGGVIAFLILVIGITYFFFPQKLVDFTNSQNANAANLESKTIMVDGYKAHYYTNNNTSAKDTLVLVHGLGDDKNSFVLSAKFLTDNYYLILPDLLASGENNKDASCDLSIKGQVEFLNTFLTNLKVNKFHLAGNSMGGHVSAAYSIAYPNNVKKLILLNAPGLKLDEHIVYTGFGSILQNEDDLNNVLSRVFYKVPDLPGPIKKMYISQINDSRYFLNNTIIPQIKNGVDFDLKNKINQIKSPTLILWGKHDKVVKFNVAERYNKDIPISEIEILENASHSPQLEIPNEVATSINNFIQKKMKVSTLKTRDQHLAKVQLHRWYQLYEREMNTKRVTNQMEILADDIYMKTAAGEMNGKQNYPERLTVYKGWKNAHHVENVSVVSKDNILQLEADIRYQNIRSDGEKKSYTIHYNTELTKNGDDLPQFSFIEIAPTGETNETFKDAYPENRTKSLMYYWLASMENLDGNVTPFKELLANNFTLNFSTSSQIKSIKELETWLNGTPMQLKESSHYPENFSVKTIMENEYEVTVEFDWKGTTKDNKHVKAKTKHIWYVLDNPNERFAKILKADVSQIEPFMVVE
jgi:pimeloyl-ACP methyl ester carboxylesterase